MKYDRIEIKKNMCPYSFDILLADDLFNLTVDYNQTHDFFTVRLVKDEEVVSAGEPVIYGMPLFKDTYIADKYPAIDIVPYSTGNTEKAVTFENLEVTTFLFIDNDEKDIV